MHTIYLRRKLPDAKAPQFLLAVYYSLQQYRMLLMVEAFVVLISRTGSGEQNSLFLTVHCISQKAFLVAIPFFLYSHEAFSLPTFIQIIVNCQLILPVELLSPNLPSEYCLTFLFNHAKFYALTSVAS